MTAFKFIRPTTITATTSSFSRNSTATYYDVSGLLRTELANAMRIGYDPATHAYLGPIIEATAATNLLTYTEHFDNPMHGAWQCSVTPNVATAPDGSFSADKVIENTTANSHSTNYAVSVTSGVTYTFSVFVKAAGRTKAVVALAVNNGAFAGAGVLLDTVLGTVSVSYGAPVAYGVTNCGNGWFRVYVSATAIATTTGVPYVGPYTTAEVYTGDGSSGLYVWGAQLETGATATSYTPSADTWTGRASVATYFDSAGLLQTASSGVARYSYNPLNLTVAPKLMLEAAATNLLVMSGDFRSVAEGGAYAQWTDSSTSNTVALNVTGPTGAANSAATITWATTASTRYANVTITSNTTVTNSCYLKAGSTTYTALQSWFNGGTVKDAYAIVNWSSNTVAVGGADAANASASITNVGNGWWRVTLTHTDTGTNTACRISLAPTLSNGTTLVTGTVLAFGAQVETGAFATSYIPTTSATVTRLADTSSSATATRAADVVTGGNYSRASTATYFDANGVMQTAPIDVPRIGYNPSTHAHTGLILEGAATNLLLRSAEFDNASWTRGEGTVSANAVSSPDGTSTADKFVGSTTASAYHYITQQATKAASAITYTGSVYLKSGGYNCEILLLNGPSSNGVVARIDATTGAILSGPTLIGSFTSPSCVVQSIGNGWFRVSITATSDTDTAIKFQLTLHNGTSSTFTGDGASGIYIWGVQLEVGAVATSYIPTTSAAVTRAADVVTGSGLTYTDVPENDYPAWVGGTTYTALTSYVIRTTATTHKVYQCLVTHTTAATPEDNLIGATPKWLEIGPTNRWALFDRKIGTETTKASSMTYLLKPGRVNSLGLLGVDAGSVEVSLIANGETVYVASIDLNSGNTVGDWYQYFYEPIYQTDAVAITNLLDAALMAIPAYGDGVLCVRFLAASGDVTCGVLAAGLYAELGTTLYDPTIGITDYSRKGADAFGNYDILERTYSKRMTAMLKVDSTAVDNTARLLTQYRNTPVVWVGADNLYSSMIVYGFCKDWLETIKGPTYSTCSIQIEGLT